LIITWWTVALGQWHGGSHTEEVLQDDDGISDEIEGDEDIDDDDVRDKPPAKVSAVYFF
jgi:hypothetical protein